MKKLLTLLTITFYLNTNAQTWVTIPDANFVTYLQTIVPGAMQHDSLNTSSTLVTTSTYTINVRNKNISDLTGVQYFTSLSYLDCSRNHIVTLPTLSNTVKTLWCSNNLLTSLPSALPTSLNYLYCDTNKLPSLPSLPHTLKYISCGFNQLSALPAFPSTLIGIYCCANTITALPTIPNIMYYLNCTSNSLASLPAIPNGMVYLYLGDNNLTTLPATLPSALQYFSCDYNYISTLPNALPTNLQFFICFNNTITNMPPLPNTLTYFDCGYNNIACFPVIPSSITTLNLDPNPYDCLPNYTVQMGYDTVSHPLCAAGNSNGCAVVAGINQPTNINSQVSLYPNPAQNSFTIETNSNDKQTLQVFDVNGKQVLSQTINGTTTIDVGNLSTGMYNLSISSGTYIINKRLGVVK